MTADERHAKQQIAPQLPLANPDIFECCKAPSNLVLAEYRPDVVARWECRVCNRRHFRAFIPLSALNLPVEG